MPSEISLVELGTFFMPVLAFWMFCFKRHWNGSLLTYIFGDRLILLLRCSYLMIRLIAVMFSVTGKMVRNKEFWGFFPPIIIIIVLFRFDKGSLA